MLNKETVGLPSLLLLAEPHRSRSLLVNDDPAASIGAKTKANGSIHNDGPADRPRTLRQAALELSPCTMPQDRFILRELVVLFRRNVQYRQLFALKYF